MTMRGFLLCYLGTVMVVGAAGAGTYHTLVQRHAATEAATAQPVAVAEAAPPDTPQVAPPQVGGSPAPAAATTTSPVERSHAAETTHVRPVPKLRPHIMVAARPALRHPAHSAVADHLPAHRPAVVAMARPEVPVYRPAPYASPPRLSSPAVGYRVYPAYPPYAGYYPYYPRYGYYRSF